MEAMHKGPTSVVRVEGETFGVGENLIQGSPSSSCFSLWCDWLLERCWSKKN